ncbi:unnamed protein product [Phyllotreta striolata]|uniref:Uncharacterized protein n=1 Tax=Phyllotreta striolata TaxID=444603 RepID=A0A9N9TKD9_PHYSR|nr:unnamed protein product [Phyllotreta striolata]
MGDTGDLATQFHHLEGDLKGERQKSLYKLITKPGLFANEKQLNDALQNIVPKTYQEKAFYVDILIYFKRTEKLLEIMKSGNQVFATKILKQQWFYDQAFANIGAKELFENFLPYFSYIVRKKLLHRISLCWQEDKMDELYDYLDKYYGFVDASDILHNCSIEKIKLTLEENEIKLKPNQVLQLYKRNPDIFKHYLTYFKTLTKTRYSEDKVVNYVALNDPKLFLELERNELISASKIGRRTTKTVMKVSKAEISSDIKRYSKFLNKPILVRKLSPDFKSVYRSVFPGKFSALFNTVRYSNWNMIKYYPKKRRWDLFFSICTEKFQNKTIKDILTSFDSEIKEYHPPSEIIHQWAKISYEKRENDYETYLKYYPISSAIQLIKERINLTSDQYKRRSLIRSLLQACAENKDLNALTEVLKYISTRHRSENVSLRSEILDEITNQFDLKELNETHWYYINEQIQLLKIQNEFSYFQFCRIFERYLEFLFENKRNHDAALDDYIQLIIGNSLFRLDLKNPAIEKEIHSAICARFPSFVKAGSEDSISYLITAIIKFDLDHKEHFIDLNSYPYFLKRIEDSFEKNPKMTGDRRQVITDVLIYNETFPEHAVRVDQSAVLETFVFVTNEVESGVFWFTSVFEKLVMKKNRSELAGLLLKYCFEKIDADYLWNELATWLLKNDPKTLVPYFDLFLKSCIIDGYTSDDITHLLIQYSHLNFDTKATLFLKQQLDIVEETDSSTVHKILSSLLMLLPNEEFIKIVEERYLPVKDKLDLQDEKMRVLYKIQCDLAKILSKVQEPYKMLPLVMKFCRGDFLQAALPALYSAFYNSPQRVLYPYVEELGKRAVSCRKHAIFLSCAVLDREHSMNLLRSTNESNASSQKHLFAATLKYFLRNPSRELLLRVVDNMKTIDKNDVETLESLQRAGVPKKFRHVYLEKCWCFFESLENADVNVSGYLETLLGLMHGDVLVAMSKEFIAYILRKYFSALGNKRLRRVDGFVVNVLRDRVEERGENAKIVFDIAANFTRKSRHSFFEAFLAVAREEATKKDFVLVFSEHWVGNFTIVQTLQEHIALRLLLIRLDNPGLDEFAAGVVVYMNELISELTFLVILTFKEQLVDALGLLELKDRLRFYLSVLRQSSDPNVCVLVIQILDEIDESDEDENEDVVDIYKEIKSNLRNVNVPIVMAYYKSRFVDNN